MNKFLRFLHSVIRRYVVAKNLISNQPKIECPPENHVFSVSFVSHFANTVHLQQKGRSTVDWAWWCNNVIAQRGPAPGSCIGPLICYGRPWSCPWECSVSRPKWYKPHAAVTENFTITNIAYSTCTQLQLEFCKTIQLWRIKGVADWATVRGPQHLGVPQSLRRLKVSYVNNTQC